MQKLTSFLLILFLSMGLYAQKKTIILRPEPTEIDISEFFSTENIFEIKVEDFEKNWLKKYNLEWTDSSKTSARTTGVMKYETLKFVETIFNFREGKFNEIRMVIFNQGDHQGLALPEVKFKEIVTKSLDSVNGILAIKPGFKPAAGAVSRNIYFWSKEPFLYRLEYSSSMAKIIPTDRYITEAEYKYLKPEFKAEYVRLVVSKFVEGVSAVNIDKVGEYILNSVQIKEKVKKDDYGNVIIEGIPMIDQGQKGYCACATTARILNFYGRNVDMHDIAKVSDASSGGTDPEELKKAITKIATAMRLNMQVVVKCYLATPKDLRNLVEKIEREYKAKGLKFVDGQYKAEEIKEVFREMAKKDPRYKDFQKGLITAIDRGQPLAWALRLGIVPEPEIPQADGGHMRIIMGYNIKEDKIFYTDSWGKGHEKKEMEISTAFYVSLAVWSISPR